MRMAFSTPWSTEDRVNAPIWHVYGGTLMSEKVKRILSSMIATVWIHRTRIRVAVECFETNDILPLAPKPPNGNPGAAS